jgi:hypothetical protein
MELKRKIQDRTDIPIDQQRLTYMGKCLKGKQFLLYMNPIFFLQDQYTAATYDIQRQCTINSVIALRNTKEGNA